MKPEKLGIICLFAIYLLWGSIFLGNRLAVETIPPLVAVMIRHGLGGLLLAFALLFFGKRAVPKFREACNALVVGGLITGVGSGGLAWAGVHVPSAFVAMGFTTMPLFMLVLNWIFFERVTPSKFDFVAMPLGLLGSGLVLFSGKTFAGESIGIFEVALLAASPFVWAFGSLLGRKLEMPKDIFISSTLQMLGGAGLMLLLSVLHGDWSRFQLPLVSQRSVWAVLYIAIGGSFLGYTAYATALRTLDTRLVGTYAVTNPVLAVGLGILFGEQVGRPILIFGMLLSISAVILTFIGARFRRTAKARADSNGSTSDHRQSGNHQFPTYLSSS